MSREDSVITALQEEEVRKLIKSAFAANPNVTVEELDKLCHWATMQRVGNAILDYILGEGPPIFIREDGEPAVVDLNLVSV